MFPIETATSRDILATLFPTHAFHSMDGVRDSEGTVHVTCSCDGEGLRFTKRDVKSLGWDGWTMTTVLQRLEDLCQTKVRMKSQ